MASIVQGDLQVTGNLSAGSQKLPSGSVLDASVAAAANIAASKLVHQLPIAYQQAGSVAAETQHAHIVRGATTTLAYVKAAVITPATGADRTVTIDLQRSTAGGAFASVLSSTIQFTNASVARTVVSGSIATSTLVQDDILQWVVTVAGAAGAQAVGVIAEAYTQETST